MMESLTKEASRFRCALHIGLPLLLVILLAHSSHSDSVKEHDNTLIIVDKSNNIANFKQTHSNLIKLIEELGQKLTIKSADDTSLKLSSYGEFLFDNILIFCPNLQTFRGSLSVKEILEFIDAGHNVLLVGNNSPGSVISELAREVGFEIKSTSAKRDYSNVKLNDALYIVGDISKYQSSFPFSYSGTQLKMLKSELTTEVLVNNAPVDDIRPSSSDKFITNVLIGAMQARNNARVVVSGSSEFFQDTAFETSKGANKQLTDELLRWLSKNKSVLRYSQVNHRKINAGETVPTTDIAYLTNFEGYTIMEEIEYSIKIEIYDKGQWKPYNGNDVQLEFVRIDPFVRLTMSRRADGTYVAQFKVPDVYGVYKFQVDYQKIGLTHLFSSTQVSVRPLRHNEYERFIYSAYPYYLSAFLMMAYLYVFSFVYMYQQKEKRNNK